MRRDEETKREKPEEYCRYFEGFSRFGDEVAAHGSFAAAGTRFVDRLLGISGATIGR